MKQVKKMNSLLMIFLVLLLGCNGRPSSDLMAPPMAVQDKQLKGSGIEFDFRPKLDILFVIDHSASMEAEQQRLIDGMDSFVDNFGANPLIDYRVGVMTVFDSRYDEMRKNDNKCINPTLTPQENEGKVDCYPIGRLRSPYIIRSKDSKESLRKALNVGTLSTEQGGPRFEEIFSPILVALSPNGNQANGNFIRPDSRLVIIIMTDEGDSTPNQSPESFVFNLKQFNKSPSLNQTGEENRIDLYAVLSTSKQKCSGESKTFENSPIRILQAIENFHGTTKNHVFSICDISFGEHLATIGTEIRKTIRPYTIHLNSIPQDGTLTLSYGGHKIEDGKGWSYNPVTQTITVSENIKLPVPYNPSLQFSVDYIEVSSMAIQKQKAKEL